MCYTGQLAESEINARLFFGIWSVYTYHKRACMSHAVFSQQELSLACSRRDLFATVPVTNSGLTTVTKDTDVDIVDIPINARETDWKTYWNIACTSVPLHNGSSAWDSSLVAIHAAVVVIEQRPRRANMRSWKSWSACCLRHELRFGNAASWKHGPDWCFVTLKNCRFSKKWYSSSCIQHAWSIFWSLTLRDALNALGQVAEHLPNVLAQAA